MIFKKNNLQTASPIRRIEVRVSFAKQTRRCESVYLGVVVLRV